MRAEVGVFMAMAMTMTAAGCLARPAPERARGQQPSARGPDGPAPAGLRRLTRQEYVNTVRDLLGVDVTDDPAGLPRDPAVSGFRNDASLLQVSDTRIAAYERLALRVAAAAPWPRLAPLAPCTELREACWSPFVERLGRLLARRPLDGGERVALGRLFVETARAGDRFEDGARLALRALLQSPLFLYRFEARGDAFAVASRLAFFLWGGAPDGALLDAAAAGALDTPERRAAIVDRMLADPRARRGVALFAEEWLGFYRLDDIPRDGWRTKGWSPALQQDMKDQARRMVVRLALDERADLTRLFTDTRVELTPTLAAIYEVPARGPGFQLYDLAADPRRGGGVLTLPAVLGAFGSIDHASIVDRGLFVLRALLCEDVPPPGDEVVVQFKEVPPNLTDRAKFDLHSASPKCATCHLDFDGLGLAFEPYDVLGRHRRKDGHGNRLRSDGDVYLDGASHTFDGPRAFGALLARSPSVERCFVSKVHQYAYGRAPAREDAAAIAYVGERYRASGRTWRALVHALAALPAFAPTPQAAR